MLKAVRASLTSGVLSWISARPKVVPVPSQYPTQVDALLLEDGFFILQENGFKILLES